jgi:hypothetical protein
MDEAQLPTTVLFAWELSISEFHSEHNWTGAKSRGGVLGGRLTSGGGFGEATELLLIVGEHIP